MRAAGRDVELTVYEGEGHGFRRSESIIDAYERELAFYRRVLALGG
jgi:dipeptidyl aminopeptidase/acylaminoacyl peptidase